MNDGALLLALRTHLASLAIATTGTMSLEATTTGYVRTTGSFLTDGFRVGMEVTPSGFSDTTPRLVTGVTALTMTVEGAPTAQTAAGGRALSVGLPAIVAYENVPATPVAGRWWLSEEFLPGGTSRQSGFSGGGEMEQVPLYVLTWYGPLGVDATALRAATDATIAHFAAGTTFALTEGTLRVSGRPAPSAGQLVRGDTWAASQVTIPLRHRYTNPV